LRTAIPLYKPRIQRQSSRRALRNTGPLPGCPARYIIYNDAAARSACSSRKSPGRGAQHLGVHPRRQPMGSSDSCHCESNGKRVYIPSGLAKSCHSRAPLSLSLSRTTPQTAATRETNGMAFPLHAAALRPGMNRDQHAARSPVRHGLHVSRSQKYGGRGRGSCVQKDSRRVTGRPIQCGPEAGCQP